MEQIIVRSLNKTFAKPEGGRKDVLVNVDLTVQRGEFVALLGPSGCGKTTLLNIMAGLDSADDGDVIYESESGATPVVSYMFQESRLLPWMTVKDNLVFVLNDRPKKAYSKIHDWLGRVGLADTEDYYPWQLSVGMQQRVAVARALIIEPDVLYMDEPFSSLDELTAMTMREELLSLWQEQECTIVMVTHNPLEAAQVSDRIAIMSPSPGRITHVMELTTQLPRPRDAEDERLWELSREAVTKLRRAGRDAT